MTRPEKQREGRAAKRKHPWRATAPGWLSDDRRTAEARLLPRFRDRVVKR